jgi:LemA protein
MNSPPIFALTLSSTQITLIVVGVVVVVVGITLISMYNRLVRLRQTCKESWSDIDTELKRRHDLIPNLVSTVKGYVTHERSVLEDVTKLRTEAMAAQSEGAGHRAGVEDRLGKSLGKLIATAEGYPDLKASANFLELQKELSETETRVARARRFFNANVRQFQSGVLTFPSNVVASIGGFRGSEFDFFAAAADDRDPVEVKFGGDA